MLLRLKQGKSAYVVHLSLEQARMLAVEMRGLATSHCPQHHLALLLAKALGGRISHVVLRLLDPAGGVLGILRVVMGGDMRDVNVDAAAARRWQCTWGCRSSWMANSAPRTVSSGLYRD